MRLGAQSSSWCVLPVSGPVPVFELDAIEAIICAVSIPIDDLVFGVRRNERVL